MLRMIRRVMASRADSVLFSSSRAQDNNSASSSVVSQFTEPPPPLPAAAAKVTLDDQTRNAQTQRHTDKRTDRNISNIIRQRPARAIIAIRSSQSQERSTRHGDTDKTAASGSLSSTVTNTRHQDSRVFLLFTLFFDPAHHHSRQKRHGLYRNSGCKYVLLHNIKGIHKKQN